MPLKIRELKGAIPCTACPSLHIRCGLSPPDGLHELPQHVVDSCLISRTLPLEPRQQVRVEPNADCLFDRPVELPDHSTTPVVDLRDIGGIDVLISLARKGE